jgi:CBS domain containing-hemolysin-like protein
MLWASGRVTAPLAGQRVPFVTEEEIKTLVDAGEEGGSIEEDEKEMIYSIFDIGDTLAREIMIPRMDVLALDVETPLPAAVDAVISLGHSRIPVYQGNIDNVVGLLYAKDLLRVWKEGGQTSLRGLLRPACFVPETKKVDDLLAELQQKRIHMAVVVDEYGGVAGLVTLEDIVEEIVGEIRDEYDVNEESLYERVSDAEYIFDARTARRRQRAPRPAPVQRRQRHTRRFHLRPAGPRAGLRRKGLRERHPVRSAHSGGPPHPQSPRAPLAI